MTRTEAARTNGALSRGPVTPEGKLRSSQNAISYGLTSAQVVIPGEDASQFQDLLLSIEQQCMPLTPREDDLVFEIAASRWRMRRLVVMEKAIIETEMERVRNDHDNPASSPEQFQARVWAAVADSNGMKQVHRHESRLRRACVKAQQELEAIQNSRYLQEQAAMAEQQRQVWLAAAPVETPAKRSSHPAGKSGLQNEPKPVSVSQPLPPAAARLGRLVL